MYSFRKILRINDWLELIKEYPNLNGAYISIAHYIYLIDKEIEKYKEVINGLKDYLKARIEVCDNKLSTPFCNFEKATKERLILSQCLEKLEELEVEHEKN